MKPTLYYTIKRCGWTDYGVFRVTSEKPRQLFGSIDGTPSHATRGDCIGKYETEDGAKTAIFRIKNIKRRYAELRKPLEDQMAKLYEAEQKEIEE